MTVERRGAAVFEERFALASGDDTAVVPVDESGRYEVRMRLDDGGATRATRWSRPPHGPATVVVDATGRAHLRQSGL